MAKVYELRDINLSITENGGCVIRYTKYEKKKKEDKEKSPYDSCCYIGSDQEAYSPDDIDAGVERLKELAKKKEITVS